MEPVETTLRDALNNQADQIFYELDGMVIDDSVTITRDRSSGKMLVRFMSIDTTETVLGVNSRDALAQIAQVLSCRV